MASIYSSRFNPVKAFAPGGCNGVVVGWNRDHTGNGLVWCPEEGGHALSFGMTRCGKGLQIIGALSQYAGSTLTIDPLGENAWTIAQRRREMGQRVVIIDPFDEVNRRYGSAAGVRETTTRFNPLLHINPRSPDFPEDVMMLAEAVIVPSGSDPHWTDSARALVAGLIAAVIEGSPSGKASFRQVRKLLTSSDAELTAAVRILHDRNPQSFAGRNLRRFLPAVRLDKKGNPVLDKDGKPMVGAVSREIGSIRSTADTQTFPFESLALLDSMETDVNAFDFSELASRRVSVFLVLPVDRLSTYGRWLRLIITLAIRAITRAPAPPRLPVLFMLDELGTINPGGGLRMIEQAYGLMAGQGIRIWGFLQDLKQLQHDYPDSWETFISNSELIQLLKVNDNTTADYFSKLMGMRIAYNQYWSESSVPNISGRQHVSTSAHKSGNWFSHTEENGLEFLFRPDQITELAASDSICIKSGGKIYETRKVSYFSDRRYAGNYRHNPLKPVYVPPPPPPAPIYVAPPRTLEEIAVEALTSALLFPIYGPQRLMNWLDKRSFRRNVEATAAKLRAEAATPKIAIAPPDPVPRLKLGRRSKTDGSASRAEWAKMVLNAKDQPDPRPVWSERAQWAETLRKAK